MIIGVIGGGAAGFFAAIRAKEVHPHAQVILFEKTEKPLAKVKISGGGRCNVTNAAPHIRQLVQAYPRGSKFLKKAFRFFDNHHTIQWYENRGIPLKTEKDLRVFPQSNSSMDIVNCLRSEVDRLGVELRLNSGVRQISLVSNQWLLQFSPDKSPVSLDSIIVATGGAPRAHGLDWIHRLGHPIVPPVPSLFSFNIIENNITSLPGLSVPNAIVRIEGTSLQHSGPLLITHWGMSGPAILVLSAFGARQLHDMNYRFSLQVNWTGIQNHQLIRESLLTTIQSNAPKYLYQFRPFKIPDRLWRYLLAKASLPVTKRWNELGKKGLNKLIDTLSHDIYPVEGKTTFKEEFVTCGGIDLSNVNPNTMASRILPNLYFAGEILDIDGITGGFNFQAAWTTGYIAGACKQ